MNFFEKYSSNTIGAGANQTFFCPKDGEVRTGIAFFKITKGGKFNYSLLFSDIIDSTFADGSVSVANMTAGGYKIHSLCVGKSKNAPTGEEVTKAYTEELLPKELTRLTFGGKWDARVGDGESVYTDDVALEFDKNDYMVIEITYSGKRVPCHTESVLPLYNKTEKGYEYSTDMPLPLMIGCDREIKGRIGYLGDSITQGIGAGYNTYSHYCARLSDMIGDEYSHYNLGIGYARATDAASDGAWLSRAKKMDTVFLCLGTNDVAHDDNTAESIAESIKSIICKLKAANCRIILQTAPPFDRVGERKKRWFRLNEIIKGELSSLVDHTFDNVPALRLSEESPEKAKYGGHPNSLGCKVWAEALYESIKK